jgi:hypothetical protein
MKYLNTICDDEIVGIEDREACIASALSVLNILFSANEETSSKLIKGNMLTMMAKDYIWLMGSLFSSLFPNTYLGLIIFLSTSDVFL